MTIRAGKPRTDVAGWVQRAIIAAFFVIAGLDKFSDAPTSTWVKIFATIGFGQWFRIATGVIEIGGGALYLFPKTCKFGAVLLASAMLGAIIAHLTVLRDPIAIIIRGAILVAIVLVALRDPNLDLIGTRYGR
ncbi:MAG TPA: DoxX family protein [Gemmatimonadaceae bacterium]|nr:DoxX family protein [Gemmatimonadaceae bacterium]